MKKIITVIVTYLIILFCCSCNKKAVANLPKNDVEYLSIKKVRPDGIESSDYEISILCLKGYYYVVAKSDRGIAITQMGANTISGLKTDSKYIECR